MASPRRPKHAYHHSLVSDYESDAHYLSDVPGPPPTNRTNEELNLAVLSRYRPDAVSLEYVVPYVVVYIFSPETIGWEKSGMEGSTFLCELSPNLEYGYRCAVVVLNRRGLENLNIELTSGESVDITEDYVIIKHEVAGETKVYGLWVFREPPPSSTSHHPEAFAAKIQECTRRAENSHRKRITGHQNGHEDAIESTPMGRQISLRELFGQQRQEDDTWSIRSHSPSRRTSNTYPMQPPIAEFIDAVTVPQFATTAETDFFRTGPSRTPNPVSPLPQNNLQPSGQQQTLLDLFRRASGQQGT